jgi:abortive infection alpha-like protein
VTARPADDAAARPHPRPGPGRPSGPRRRAGRGLALPEPAPTGQVVAAAGSAIVTAAKMGRILGRSGWRIARQLPGVNVVEQQAQRLRQAATAELTRLLDVPQQLFPPAGAEEERVMLLVQDAATDPEPLRTAMSELLERSAASANGRSREYLFGTIVSQLVPDEARILAVLAERAPFPVVDVVAKQVARASTRVVLANVSTVGVAAGVAAVADTPTYLGRLQGFGLLEFAPAGDGLDDQFKPLLDDPSVVAAKAHVERTKAGSPRITRKTVTLSPLGREFWSACAPSR